MSTTMDDSGPTTATEERDYVYKGKATNRSWPQLPEEIIRLIGTYYLQSFTATAYVPYTWESYDNWQQRLLYMAIRDGMTLERNMMSVCVGWHRALQTHYSWTRSTALLDPMNMFAPYMFVPQAQHSSGRTSPQTHRHSRAGKAQTQLTPWRHFRNILSCCCLVCRMNNPNSSFGFITSNGHRRPMVFTAYLNAIPVCRDHEKRKVSFCGACLRDNPTLESATLQSLIGFGPGINPATVLQQHQDAISAQIMDVACNENEDEEMWPGIEATCKTCRLEWLWRKACYQPLDREAIGGPPPPDPPHSPPWLPIPSLQTLLQNSPDWEIRHAVEGFVDMAEGTISEVLTLAREKYWLQKHTRLRELMSQALAARRWVSSAAGESVMGGVSSRGEALRVTSHERPYESQQESDPRTELQDEIDPNDSEREHAQLALDMELAIQLEREEAETEEGEYDETAPRQVRAASPPVERPLPPHMQQREERRPYEPPATIQLSPEATAYNSEPSPGTNTTATTATVISLDDAELERFDEVEDDTRSQTYAHSDLSDDHFEEEEEEEEEDASILQTVEKDVVLLALEDWTRSKILDGYWISPADVWFNHDTIYKRQHLDVDTEIVGEAADSRKVGWTLAVHPCSWTIERDGDRTDSDPDSDESHPRWNTVVEQGPVTFAQARQAYDAHQRQLQTILLPPMRNIVRKIVIECGADAPLDGLGSVDTRRRPRTESTSSSSSSGSAGRKRKRSIPPARRRQLRDPVLIATRMTLEDVVKVLREEEGVWFDGFDWLEKGRNVREAEDSAAEKRKRDESRMPQAATTPMTESPPKKRRKTQDGEEEDGRAYGNVSAASEGVVEEDGTSSGSGTSPVLSTSTLQTTPSPPPSNNVPLGRGDSKGKAAVRHELEEEEESDAEYDDEPPVRIPVVPALESPRMLRPIPYIPLSIEGFPQHTIQTLTLIWRQALAPLFQCRCRICLRAIAAVEAEKAARRPAGSEPAHYAREAPPDRRETYERERTAPPPPSPRRDGNEPQPPYRIPAIRLRPVKPDLPREREEEEEEEDEEEEEYETASADDEEFMKLAAEDPTFEKIIYHPPNEDEDEDDGVVEIDIRDVDVFNDAATPRTPTRTSVPPGARFAADGTPATPIRSARKRSCDDQERELDHTGKTVSVLNADDTVPRAVSSVSDDLREYAIRPPSPPKRQKTTAS